MEGRPLEERELVLRAQRGDALAYEEIVRTHQQIAFRVAYLVTGNAAEAEDAAQEGFIKAWRAFGRFKPELPVRPWLLQIVANEARNRRGSTSVTDPATRQAMTIPGNPAPDPTSIQDAPVCGSKRTSCAESKMWRSQMCSRLDADTRFWRGLSTITSST